VAVVVREDVAMVNGRNVRVAIEPIEPRDPLPTATAPSARNGPIASLAEKRRKFSRVLLVPRVEAKDAPRGETNLAEDAARSRGMGSTPRKKRRVAIRNHAPNEHHAVRDASREVKRGVTHILRSM